MTSDHEEFLRLPRAASIMSDPSTGLRIVRQLVALSRCPYSQSASTNDEEHGGDQGENRPKREIADH